MTSNDPPRHLEVVTGHTASHDPQTERALLGLCITVPGFIDTLGLSPSDFYRPAHEWLYARLQAIHTAGEPITATTVNAQLMQHPEEYRKYGGAPFLFEITQTASTELPETAHYLAGVLRRHTRKRRLSEMSTRLGGLSHTDDLEAALADAVELTEQLYRDEIFSGVATRIRVPDLVEFLSQADAEYRWLIPGILERTDRVILTGGEGSGKSTLGRQLAIQTATGLHPFTGDPIQPVRVLLLDLENSEAQLRRELRKLHAKVARRINPNTLYIQTRPSGLDLANDPDDRTWLRDLLAATRPDLLITGPIYKMAGGNPNAEEDTKPVALYLDKLRTEFDLALWLEAHVGNEQAGSKKRPERPVGWSGWRRWPEFGMFLGPEGDLIHWRPGRDERDWPRRLTRGGDWPWTPVDVAIPKQWIAIVECIEKAGKMLSNREIAKRTGIPSSTVDRRVREFSMEYQGLLYRYATNPEDE